MPYAVEFDAVCPHCGRTVETHVNSEIADTHPAPVTGDVSLCMACGEVSVYVNGPFGMMLRAPTPPDETMVIDADEGVAEARQRWRRWRLRRTDELP